MLMYLHLSQLLNFLTAIGGLVAAIILWQTKKDEVADMDEHGKEVLNFQISILIYSIIASILCVVLIGFILLPIIGLLAFIFPILNGIKAKDGKPTNYPLTIKIIK